MSEAEATDVALPDVVGSYRVLREVGRGGMGRVYEAVHMHLQRRVAIKLLQPELATDPKQVERFVREGRSACQIRHPHVVDVFELGFEGECPYLVMDFVPGVTLAARLRQAQRLDVAELLSVMLPVLSALAAAHAAGVVHRDLKPDNILLRREADGRITPKVVDFGISKLVTKNLDNLTLTTTCAVLGTPLYMSPEQARSSRDADAASDQYALGVILYECATGCRPFTADNPYSLIHAIMTAPVTPPSDRVAGLPAGFDAVVLRAMSRAPSERFADVRELGAALLRFAPTQLAAQYRAEFGPEPTAISALPVCEPSLATTCRAEADVHGTGARRPRRLPLALSAALLLAAGAYATWSYQRAAPATVQRTSASSRPRVPQPTAAPQTAAGSLTAAREPVPEAPAALPPAPLPPAPTPAAPAKKPPPRSRGEVNKPARTPAPSPVVFGENGAPILE